MITACPKCAARYRIDPERLRPEGSRLRCSRCEAVFRVRPGGTAPNQPDALAPAKVAAAPPETSTSEPRDESRREKLVLVADPGVESGKAVAGALTDWGLEAILVHDGVEAILTIQRTLPRAVVLDAALPKMFGFQVCELMKRNESLRSIHVVLVGAIHDQDRYRRSPSDLYGADSYIERPQLPDGLRSVLESLGLPVEAAAAQEPVAQGPEAVAAPAIAPEPEPVAAARPAPTAAPCAPEPAASAPAAASAEVTLPEVDEAVSQAERLARIIVSDIVIYNQEKFDAASTQGNVVQAMDKEIEEGRALFAERVDAAVRASRDFLAEELERIARQREGG